MVLGVDPASHRCQDQIRPQDRPAALITAKRVRNRGVPTVVLERNDGVRGRPGGGYSRPGCRQCSAAARGRHLSWPAPAVGWAVSRISRVPVRCIVNDKSCRPVLEAPVRGCIEERATGTLFQLRGVGLPCPSRRCNERIRPYGSNQLGAK